MKITKFLNIDIEPAPPEMELQIEMQCREIMQSDDLDNIKRYCTHLVRKKFDQDIFMASLLNRLIELEANRVVLEMRKEQKNRLIQLRNFFVFIKLFVSKISNK